MLVKAFAAAVQGIDAIRINVEVVVDRGIGYTIVGLPDAAVKESGDRVQTALAQAGEEWPRRHVIVNLSPADVRKEGSAYDLPIAVGVLAADEKLPADRFPDYMIMGELSLDGTVLPIKGALPIAILARQLGYKGLILPAANATEAAVVNNLEVYGAENLRQVIDFLKGSGTIEPTVVNTREEFARSIADFGCDFSEVKGQENVKRAFEVACAGGHNIILVGPPGSGKSMMAKRLPSILPPLTLAEALETTKIHSVAGKLKRGSMLMAVRPFRSPHHTISPVALVGGGANPMPGEISLAHNGLLFMDEFPEFSRGVLEVMRQPLEDRHITIARAKYTIDYPAGFMLVASMNPCPCGYYNHPSKPCTCSPGQVQKYLNKVSGPLMDRIDIQCEILPVPFSELSSDRQGENSETIRRRVILAREIQGARFRGIPEIHCNAQMDKRLINTYCRLDDEGMRRLETAMTRLDMSARAFDRILKVARTIADLENTALLTALTPASAPLSGTPSAPLSGVPGASDHAQLLDRLAQAPILPHHISEAISYRNLDRSSWGQVTLVK